MRSTLVAITLMCMFLPALGTAQTEFYVSNTGSDSNPGSKDKPFATMDHARDVLRLSKLGPGGATIWIREGTYHRIDTFTLFKGDSGRKDAPIVYRAFPGEKVVITGGRELTGLKLVTDPAILNRLDPSAHGKTLQCDLKALGITDYGSVTGRGFGRPSQPAGLELFFRNQRMTLARWPNDNWARIADVPAGPNGGKFTYDGDRPSRWAKADDVWLHGYWTWDWAESYEKIKSIDTQTKEIATEPPHGVYGYKKGARYYVLNLLEELDQPGEWYLDRKTGILYFWPPEQIRSGDLWASLMDNPLISMDDASYITFQGLTLEYVRGTAVRITSGSHNLIAGCTLRNIGNIAVNIKDGTSNGVDGCDVYDTGDNAIGLSGGARATLAPAGNYVRNCDIHHFSQWVRTYNPSIAINGVGNIIANNKLHDAPHCAILLHGNDHVIEYNDIYRVCMETQDAGAFYLGRDWTEYGNEVRYNYFHDMVNANVDSVYLDDWASGTRVYSNVFYKAGRGVLLGGGRENTIGNNVFIDCRPAIHVDARGQGWAKSYFNGKDNTLFDRYKAMNASQPPYSTHYPKLKNLLNDEPAIPKGNAIARNISFGGRWIDWQDGMSDKIVSMKDNMVDVDPGFVDQAHGNFQLRDDSPAWALGFKRIPMERIGLHMDEYRTTLPTDENKSRIRKLGTIVCDLVEATPVVFKGRLYRFEYVRDQYYKPNLGKPSYFRFVDEQTGEETPGFAQGYHLGSAFVEGDTAWAFGVNKWDGDKIGVFWSRDLKTWESEIALDLPNWGIFNTSVCRGDGKYIMAFEIGRPAEETGVPFTIRFAESKDLKTWKLTPKECVYSKDRYTACPAIRYLDGYYYMIYLEAYPGPAYKPHIVRSKDLVKWESSPLNPVMDYSFEDKYIANPKLTAEERERIQNAVDINNSDIDFCEFEGKTHIVYSWGNQQGIEHLAEAVYDGPMNQFLKSFFPK